MEIRQRRLATGKRIIDPTDDPAAYFTASGLNARAAALNSLLDQMGTAQKTFEAATKAVQGIQSLLQSAQSISNQALASASTVVRVTGTNTSALNLSTQISSGSGNSTRFRNGDTVTITDGSTTATYTAGSNDTVQTMLNAINNTANLKVTASLNASGQVQLQATGANNITVGGSFSGLGTLNSVLGLTAGTTTFVANTTRQSLAQQFDNIRTQIDQVVQDASYNGVNLLSGGALSVSFNETGTSKLAVSGVQYSSSALGLPAAFSGSGGQFQTDAEISTALNGITSALSALQTQSAVFGSSSTILTTRKDFARALVDTLQGGADDLVAADTSEESTMLLALQTRQQVAATSLSFATQRDNAALRILGLQ